MEIKYSILTMDKDGNLHNAAHHIDESSVSKFVDILMSGEDPNKLLDIVIRPEIVR